MFIGEYRHSLDAKNRLIIPANYRKELGDTFIVTKGNEGCLRIYNDVEWKKEQELLAKLPSTNKAARQYTRFVMSGAMEVSCDSQGRIQISAPLKEYAGLTKNCVITGANQFVEIWDEINWKQYVDMTAENFDEIAEELTELLK